MLPQEWRCIAGTFMVESAQGELEKALSNHSGYKMDRATLGLLLKAGEHNRLIDVRIHGYPDHKHNKE